MSYCSIELFITNGGIVNNNLSLFTQRGYSYGIHENEELKEYTSIYDTVNDKSLKNINFGDYEEIRPEKIHISINDYVFRFWKKNPTTLEYVIKDFNEFKTNILLLLKKLERYIEIIILIDHRLYKGFFDDFFNHKSMIELLNNGIEQQKIFSVVITENGCNLSYYINLYVKKMIRLVIILRIVVAVVALSTMKLVKQANKLLQILK